jgi:WD40 repeat protein
MDSQNGSDDIELGMHDGTVRDVVFMGDAQTLVSGGAGDCKLYVTDCPSGGQTVAALPGHAGHILSLCTWAAAGGSVLCSGSQVKGIKLSVIL